jgi:hypothetical protein
VEGEGEVLLFESSGSLKVELKSSLKNMDSKAWILGREEEELKIWISKEALIFLIGQQPYEVGAGLFIAPTSKEPLGRAFTEQVW